MIGKERNPSPPPLLPRFAGTEPSEEWLAIPPGIGYRLQFLNFKSANFARRFENSQPPPPSPLSLPCFAASFLFSAVNSRKNKKNYIYDTIILKSQEVPSLFSVLFVFYVLIAVFTCDFCWLVVPLLSMFHFIFAH